MDILTNLIEDNTNLIYKISTFYPGYSNKEDLFQAGCVGLIKAYKKYNEGYNTKFSTYAYPFILGEINNYVKSDKGIKISREISKLNLKIEKASILLTQKLMREPTVEEISSYLEIDEFLVVEALKSRYSVLSVDSVVTDDGKEITLLDTIPNPENMDMNTLIALREELSNLTDDEKMLINNRYINSLTQAETAVLMGRSQVQVSRQEKKVLTKLRNNLYS